MLKKLVVTMISLTSAVILSACGENSSEDTSHHESTETVQKESGMDENHAHMHHSSDGEIPEGLKVASNPKFPIGSTAIMKADHMEGMNGEEATIVGAFDTTVYAVSYIPTNGGEQVKNHKWVIYEEVQSENKGPLQQNSEVNNEENNSQPNKNKINKRLNINPTEETPEEKNKSINKFPTSNKFNTLNANRLKGSAFKDNTVLQEKLKKIFMVREQKQRRKNTMWPY